jgi:hypothetical protein
MAASPALLDRARTTAVGASSHPDASTAAREAVTAALSQLTAAGAPPGLLVVYASSSYDLDALAGALGSAAGTTPLIGCTTAGEIATSGPGEAGVVALALGGDGFSVAVGMGEIVDGDLRRAGATAARCVESVERRQSTILLMLSDGLAGDQQEVVRGAYDQVGAEIPLVGGCAGDDLRMELTHQFLGGQVVSNAVVAAAISSDGAIGIGVRHGWRPVGEPMTVTGSDGVVVTTLDDEPALDVYLAHLDAPAKVQEDSEAFTAHAATRPLGLSRRGRDEIRFVATADFERRTITCFAEVPQGGQCSIMEGDAESVLSATDDACSEALAALHGAAPHGVMVFDCIARKGVLGEGIVAEVEQIGRRALGAPIAGFYTYGEIARTTGSSGFHNQTLVVLALG